MLNAGLLEEVPAPAEHRDLGWRQEEGGRWIALRITKAGLSAVGIAPETATGAADQAPAPAGVVQEAHEARVPALTPTTTARPTLYEAAVVLLSAWDAGLERPALPASMEALRSALAGRQVQGRAARDPSTPRLPREGTKQQAVLTLLRRFEGSTIAQVMDATGWAQHTVRGFLAGLKKKGHSVEVLQRVRQVGPGAQGAKGSYSISRIGAEEQG